jgi:ferredoxin|tara:strand:+ start:108 stop:455 length:348 start_codon:yes stop_codon:yes gene_type:complete
MAILITDECINCGACEPECPNNAIYEGGDEWSVSEGTEATGSFKLLDGDEVDAFDNNKALSDELFYIVPEKCTECKGFHDEPQCATVCPVDCCEDDPDNEETEEELLEKQARLHE